MPSSAREPLVLDISPALINRTAVYRLTLDLVEHFKGKAVARSLGTKQPTESFDLGRFGRAAKELHFWFRAPVWARPAAWIAARRALRPTSRGHRVLYLDPLYTLFHRDLDDAFIVINDLTPVTRPEWHEPRIVELYRHALRRIAGSRARIAVISESTGHDLRVNYGIPAGRITPIMWYLQRKPPIARIEDAAPPFLLFVGSLELRKNLIGLIDGYRLSGLHARGIGLKVVGTDARGAFDIRRHARAVPGVELLGFVGDEELDRLYASCRAFVYPSFWEGFGVPLLEAMARGIPCVSTDSGASPEVGGDAPIYVDPTDTRSIARGMARVAALGADERRAMVERGFSQAARFTREGFMTRMEGWLWQ